MKCILVGPAFPLRGGIANFNEALCKSMLEIGIECQIVSFSLQYPGFLFPGKTQFEAGSEPSGLRIHTLINSLNPYTWFKAASFIKSQKPDFVLIRYWLPFMAPCLGTIARLIRKKIKVIAITDNIIPHEKRTGDKQLTSYFVNSCDSFVAMSKAVLEDISMFTENTNKFFAPHPVYNIFGEKIEKEKARRHLGLDESGRYILFFGFIRKYKGLDILLEAMTDPELKKQQVKLIVAGEFYEDEKEYRDYVKVNNLENSVLFFNSFIPREEVRCFFCAADMVVQPYREATQSGVTQIAYYFERPMLVTRVGGLAEIVKEGRVGYVTDVDATLIGSAINDFYKNNREAFFASNVSIDKQLFSWESFINKILEAKNTI